MRNSASDFFNNKYKKVENPKNKQSNYDFLLQNYNDFSDNEFPDEKKKEI